MPSTTDSPKRDASDSGSVARIDLTDSDPARVGMHSWFDRWADSVGLCLPELWGAADREMGGVLRIEEIVDDGGLTFRGELPGVDPNEDVEITVENGRLTINAERRQHEETEEGGRRRSEFRYGSYGRTLSLPAGTDASSITATYDDGILEVRVPVDGAQAEAARIPVQKRK
jgi:HSP20 family protein